MNDVEIEHPKRHGITPVERYTPEGKLYLIYNSTQQTKQWWGEFLAVNFKPDPEHPNNPFKDLPGYDYKTCYTFHAEEDKFGRKRNWSTLGFNNQNEPGYD